MISIINPRPRPIRVNNVWIYGVGSNPPSPPAFIKQYSQYNPDLYIKTVPVQDGANATIFIGFCGSHIRYIRARLGS